MRVPTRILPLLAALGALVAQAAAPSSARAQSVQTAPPSAADRKRAAAAYDEGVALFKRAEYAAAARAFSQADTLLPSAVAITNAIAAARRARDHLLVALLAERAIARGDALTPAREALVEAAGSLARLELACEPAPCTIWVDGERVSTASLYVLPGAHQAKAEGAGGARAEEPLRCIAGATYRVALHPVAPGAPVPPIAAAGPRVEGPPHQGPGTVSIPPRAASRGLHKGFFFAAAGVTVVLAGVTTWSGVDAIAAKDALPTEPEQSQNDAVLARARRTDFLLGGALLAGVGAAVLGVWFTDWRGAGASATVLPLPGGGALAARGRF